MAQQIINNGSAPGDGTGESLYSAFDKVNANDAELYAENDEQDVAIGAARTQFYANRAAFPATGNPERLYLAEDTRLIYHWDGSVYVVLTSVVETGAGYQLRISETETIQITDPSAVTQILACRSGSLAAPIATVSPAAGPDLLYALPQPIVIPAGTLEPGDHVEFQAWMRKQSGANAWTAKAFMGHLNSASDKTILSYSISDVSVNRQFYLFGTAMIVSNSTLCKTNYITPGGQTTGSLSDESGMDFLGSDVHINFGSGGPAGNVLDLLGYRVLLHKGR